ncbi:hypothetical protein [Cohnella sp. REN36]|uniref:hypothetical protein n=1 Tax=Cohnella sp. REN36 TaxID=2887347 RepID=UPI001D151149|nr:hypothetical protein [Cohnella sp. REN36]MCC3373102.1 hypothetical protein [Cohnella sp. REN36]
MNKRKWLPCAVACIALVAVLAACASKAELRESDRIIQVSRPDGDRYKIYKEIREPDRVSQAEALLRSVVDGSTAIVSMSRTSDYRIAFENTIPGSSANRVVFDIWRTPKDDRVEVVLDPTGAYAQLDPETSRSILRLVK